MSMTLKAARVNCGLTQKEAAEKLEISRSTLMSWENGKSAPREPHIRKLEQLYGVSYNEIIFCPNITL